MSYTIDISPYAERQLKRLHGKLAERIDAAIDGLEQNPRPHGCIKVITTGEWRIRIGSYRIKYTIDDDERIVSVTSVSPRDDAY